MTERELLRLHIEAVWDLTLPAINETLHELVLTQRLPPWSLYVGEFAQEQVAIWHSAVAPAQRLPLLEQARQARVDDNKAFAMHQEVVFHYPIIGPAQQAQAQQQARVLSVDDTDLINTFEVGSAPIFLKLRNAPCIGVIVDGYLLSVAHISRQTASACELGIDTLPEARGRGYATAATILWTTLVQQKGLVPIYSAHAENTASLHLAKTTGYMPQIHGVYGPMPEGSE